jgi:hypothetical protein
MIDNKIKDRGKMEKREIEKVRVVMKVNMEIIKVLIKVSLVGKVKKRKIMS